MVNHYNKLFFNEEIWEAHCVFISVAAIFRELPEESSQIKGKLRKVAVDLNHQQKNVEMCNLTGSVIAAIGGSK